MINIDQNDLSEARRLNRRLAWSPRFPVPHRLGAWLMQSLLVLSQSGADRKLRRAGIRVEARTAAADGATVSLRLLRPSTPVRGVVLDIHGGGWAIGNARMNDALNAALAEACGVAVVSVDYRLASATPISGLIEDCLVAARWVLGGGLPEYRGLPVVLVGESAGAHLAAATLLELKRWPDLLGRVAGAVLYYGVYDLAGTDSARRAGPATLVLKGPRLITGLQRLTPGMSDDQRREPPLSPLYGDLRGLPPALMFVGELDPFQDDTLRMAERWREAAEVELHLLPEAPHGFIHFNTGMASKVLARGHAWICSRLADPAGQAEAGGGVRPAGGSAEPHTISMPPLT
ncbi:alpha/beta hydrolase [Roseococcus sp. SYP-B2431]|uniref:alpha/beta hydrolase n=1 Tax=Roseococcus sp. SYP-B2431 TaxID=2496640 RepID=UPI0010390B74|nr:alpha/beta hydrolase [Roseococcus sp. SYP-B2431]TCH98673.1 alpha/beta hydrolase [Roseococcus sp. SYP-B2431]